MSTQLEEIWRPIEGYDGYEVSNLGRVRRITITYIKPDKSDIRRYRYPLHKSKQDKKGKKEFGHILVAKAFPEICGKWFNGCEVHHKDRNSKNNKAENLICLTKQEHTKEHYEELAERARAMFSKSQTEEAKQKSIISKSKPIYQVSKDGEIVKEWLSVTECERQTGYDKAAINRCCLGKQKTSYGYMWQYKETAA